MCCIGCQAVATAIVEGGLESFYRFRTEINSRPDEEQVSALERWRVYDLPEVQSEFVLELDEQRSQASLLLDRKSTRLNSSHVANSYAVFCLKKKTDINS